MLGAPPAFVLSQDQTLYKWYLSLKSVKSCSLSTQSLASCVNYFWNCFKCFSKHIKVPYKFFDIVQFSRSCAPQPFGWRPVYCTTEVFFCQALFLEAFELSELGYLRSFSEQTVSLSGWDPSILLSQDRSVCLNAPLGRFIALATAKLFSVYWFFSRASCWGSGSHSFASALGAQV